MLEVIGTVQQLHLRVELTGVGVEEDLDLIHGGVEVDGVHGAPLDVPSLVGREEVGALGGETRLGVRGGGVEGKVSRSGVIDVDGGGLVPGPDERLDGTHEPVLGVGLDLHGGPVGSDPQFDEGFHGAAVGVHGHLDDFLVGVGEFPVLARLALDADRAADAGQVPFGGYGGLEGDGRSGDGGGEREAVDGADAGQGDEGGDELHG